MSNKILIKRGLKASMPTLDIGEFGLATDTNEVFIGTPTGNELVNSNDYEPDSVTIVLNEDNKLEINLKHIMNGGYL